MSPYFETHFFEPFAKAVLNQFCSHDANGIRAGLKAQAQNCTHSPPRYEPNVSTRLGAGERQDRLRVDGIPGEPSHSHSASLASLPTRS
jgi:hypothetical protein